MSEFPFIPANKQSIAGRKLIFGIALNDASYQVKPKVSGKRLCCPFYKTWMSMLVRCYSGQFLSRHRTYEGCNVDDDWLVFSNFKKWMLSQDWQGMHLDKDLLVPKNKTYGPDKCIFLHPRVNTFISDIDRNRGQYLQGVCNLNGRFQSRIYKSNGERKHLGYFDTEKDAHLAWAKEKSREALDLASQQKDRRTSAALLRIADALENSLIHEVL